MPWIPGNTEQMLPNLRALLRSIEGDGNIERQFTWPESGAVTTIRQCLNSLGFCGLTASTKQPAGVALTSEGRTYLVTNDNQFLLAILHANVRFVGEALALLENGITHEGIKAAAEKEYGLEWSTMDQVRRRASWFRALEFAEFWSDGRLFLTEAGRECLGRLILTRPGDLPHRKMQQSEPVEIPMPSEQLRAELEALDQDTLRKRRRYWGYTAGQGLHHTFRLLLGAANPEITRDELLSLCVEEYDVKKSSAEATLNTLRSLDFIVQTGPDSFSPTDIALDFLTSDAPIDLIRAMHTRVALMGETLAALIDETHTGKVAALLAHRYPDIDLPRSEVTRRLQLLGEAGLAQRITQTSYHITRLGIAFLETLPLLDVVDEAPSSTGYSTEANAAENETVAPANTHLVTELVESSTDSARPRRFELAVVDAFRVMGLDVEHHGGPGKADSVAELWLSPVKRLRLAIESKTEGNGQVREDAIKFDALEEHRKHHKADRTVLVGPGFGGRLPQWAKKNGIIAITARELAKWMKRQACTPLYPHELAALFTPDGVSEVDSVWRDAERKQEALRSITQILWESANDPDDIEFAGGSLALREIRRIGKSVAGFPLDPGEIEEVLSFLSNPFISGATSPKTNEYVAAAAPSIVAAKLRMLADAVSPNSAVGTAAQSTLSIDRVPQTPESARSVESDRSKVTAKYSASDVRAWARENGRRVPDRGRLPSSVVSDYLASLEDGQQTIL
jgi:hypothetical protein